MTPVWKKRSIIFGSWTAIIALISASQPFFTFIEAFPILIAIPAAILTHLISKDPTDEDSEEIQALHNTIAEYERVIEEDYKVLSEYENIFDAQLVELPCVCGGNTFKGLFSPNMENLVECEKCHNKYKVNIQYDTVLLSEPMDQHVVADKLKEINNIL